MNFINYTIIQAPHKGKNNTSNSSVLSWKQVFKNGIQLASFCLMMFSPLKEPRKQRYGGPVLS